MDDDEIRIAIKTIDNIEMVEKLADDHKREKINFQQIADVMHTDNFIKNLSDDSISFEENKKINHMKDSKANYLLKAFRLDKLALIKLKEDLKKG